MLLMFFSPLHPLFLNKYFVVLIFTACDFAFPPWDMYDAKSYMLYLLLM